MSGWDVAPQAWDGVSSTCGECTTVFAGHGCPGCGQLADATDYRPDTLVMGSGLVDVIGGRDVAGYEAAA